MTPPWQPGQEVVATMIDGGQLDRLRGADAGVPGLLLRADQLLGSARTLADSDPASAITLAYDGVQHAGMALLAEQNLRAPAAGGHIAIERTLTAQFGGLFQQFGRLRRRRNELDYPVGEEDGLATTPQAFMAIEQAAQIVADARELIERKVLTEF